MQGHDLKEASWLKTMPTELGRSYSPTWRGKYPHMLQPDFPVWERFLDKYAERIVNLYYDVRVGEGGTDALGYDAKMAHMYRAVTAKRLDALIEFEDVVWLVEVSSGPGLRAVGQLAAYLALYVKDPKIDKPSVPVLICDRLDPDLKTTLDLYSMHAIEI